MRSNIPGDIQVFLLHTNKGTINGTQNKIIIIIMYNNTKYYY